MIGKYNVNPFSIEDAFTIAARNLDKKTHTISIKQLKRIIFPLDKTLRNPKNAH